MKISKVQSEAVNRRTTHNTMSKGTNNDLQYIPHQTEDRVIRTLKERG